MSIEIFLKNVQIWFLEQLKDIVMHKLSEVWSALKIGSWNNSTLNLFVLYKCVHLILENIPPENISLTKHWKYVNLFLTLLLIKVYSAL